MSTNQDPDFDHHEMNYLVASEQDKNFGVVTTTIGRQSIPANSPYPPQGKHPSKYFFDPKRGRVLDEYQIIYITDGAGSLSVEGGSWMEVNSGDLILLFPNVRHSYQPLPHKPWNEYWIGFKGDLIETLIQRAFPEKNHAILNIGHNEQIVQLFHNGIRIAKEERSLYQKALAGTLINILGGAIYARENLSHKDRETIDKMERAKVLMREMVNQKINFEHLATQLNMGYSSFRKKFRDIIGVSPAYYYQELKLEQSKHLLSDTNKSIKEIAHTLSYNNPESFIAFFRKHTQLSPKKYRDALNTSNNNSI